MESSVETLMQTAECGEELAIMDTVISETIKKWSQSKGPSVIPA